METAKRARSRIPVVAAAILFAPAVGAGVFVGRSIPDRTPLATTTSTGSGLVGWRHIDRQDLATCQEKLTAQTKTLAPVASADASPGDAERIVAQAPTTVEGLEAELRRCTKSELIVSAEVCSAAARQFEALIALPKDGLRCGQKSRAADLIEENFEHCATVAFMQADVRPDDLTKEEASIIADAMRIHQTLTEKELLRQLKEFVYTCTDTPPKLPPGANKPPKWKRKGADQ